MDAQGVCGGAVSSPNSPHSTVAIAESTAPIWSAPPTRGLPQALVSGYVWGTGSSAFLVGRRARVIRDNDETRIADCLQSVADQLRLGNPTDAYESMFRGRPNNLKHLGPSFFTKFLYAADAEGTRPGRALILDQFVAVALKDLDGWDISRNGPWEPTT